MKSPVSVCIIVKDDPFLEKCILSFKDYVEEIVIVLTGNDNNETKKIAQQYADIVDVYLECNDPVTGLIEDFSKARNRSFDLATQPWIMWCDSDDLIDGADKLPEILLGCDPSRLQLEGVGILFPYEYAYDGNGKCICRHYRERLFYNRRLFNFINPVHEVVVPDNSARTALITKEELVFKHQRQYNSKQQEGGRNLRILRNYFEKNKDDARQMYYLGLECANAGLIDESIAHLSKYVDVSGWDDERAMACLKLVEIYTALSRPDNALKWAFRTIEVKENWCEGYFAVAKIFYHLAEGNKNNSSQNYWAKVVHFIKLGFTMPPTQSLLFLNPTERAFDIHQYYNMALNKIGEITAALDSVNTALLNNPTDPNMLLNKRLYEIFLTRKDITTSLEKLKEIKEIDRSILDNVIMILDKKHPMSGLPPVNGWSIPSTWDFNELPLEITDQQMQSSVVMLWKQYMLHDDLSSAITFLENVPSNIKDTDVINTALELTKKCLYSNLTFAEQQVVDIRPNSNPLDIIFFAGDGLEVWTPETVKKTGIGGSELMLIEQAKRLVKLGNKVRVYSSCGAYASIHDGVQYYPTNRFKDLTCDVLVISRQANMLDDKYNIISKLKLLWVHDVYALNSTNELLLKADRILALSEWHKQNLIQAHNLHPDHILVTRNGIDLSRFNKNIVRNKFKCVVSSSPDRYLAALLQAWPIIKSQVPQASLSIFYGFDNWEKVAHHYPGQSDLIKYLKTKIKELEPLGVSYYGRVSGDRLAEEFLSAGAWSFSTWFAETSCCSAMEAQAAGCRIITSNIAALKETVADRGLLIDGDWVSNEYQTKFINGVVAALKKDDDSDRLKLQQYAKENFSLDSLAKDWQHMFHSLIDDMKVNPVVPYYPTEDYRRR